MVVGIWLKLWWMARRSMKYRCTKSKKLYSGEEWVPQRLQNLSNIHCGGSLGAKDVCDVNCE